MGVVRFLSNTAGTMLAYFRIGMAGPRLKSDGSGNLQVRNAADAAYSNVTANIVNLAGTSGQVVMGYGGTYTFTLQTPAGMTGNVAISLPPTLGTAGQVLQTNADTTTSWVNAGSTAQCVTAHTESIAYNSTSTITAFTLPANAVVEKIVVYVDTLFNGTNPSLTVGISGTTSKYMGATDSDLTTVGCYENVPGVIPPGTTENLIVTYSAGSSSSGAARVEIHYAVPINP